MCQNYQILYSKIKLSKSKHCQISKFQEQMDFRNAEKFFSFAFLYNQVIKLFSCSTQLSMKFILLINVRMPAIAGILTFISRINDCFYDLNLKVSLILVFVIFMGILDFMLS